MNSEEIKGLIIFCAIAFVCFKSLEGFLSGNNIKGPENKRNDLSSKYISDDNMKLYKTLDNEKGNYYYKNITFNTIKYGNTILNNGIFIYNSKSEKDGFIRTKGQINVFPFEQMNDYVDDKKIRNEIIEVENQLLNLPNIENDREKYIKDYIYYINELGTNFEHFPKNRRQKLIKAFFEYIIIDKPEKNIINIIDYKLNPIFELAYNKKRFYLVLRIIVILITLNRTF